MIYAGSFSRSQPAVSPFSSSRSSKGDLQYKIDLATLTGETYEMARAVNEMGDGLQEAVEAIVRNERLKAELITNVSHDLKTPLLPS